MSKLEQAEKAAEHTRKVRAQHQKKAIQQAQKRKEPALQAISSSNKRQNCAGTAHAGVQAQDAPSTAPPKVTSCGHNINLPQKLR
jgi:hypothetical protein